MLEHISTMETVRDLDLLRGLVGDSKINYFGVVVRHQDRRALCRDLFPQRVGRMVLDGAVDINSQVQDQAGGRLRAGASPFRSRGVPEEHCRLGAQRDDVLLHDQGLP